MNRRFACMFLAGIMALSMAGCGGADTGDRDDIGQEPAPDTGYNQEEPLSEPVDPCPEPEVHIGYDIIVEPSEMPDPEAVDIIDTGDGYTDVNPNWFDDELQRYLESEKSWAGKSYMVSPASFRAALCLAIEGSDGDTRSDLLRAAGFQDYDSMRDWYGSLLSRQAAFMERYDFMKSESELYGDGSDPGMGFDLANAVWDNSDILGGFLQEYADAVSDKYGATAAMSDADSITSDVNSWCDEKTHGMIRSISNDLSWCSSVLANALYVKSGWLSEFSEYMTGPGTFTKADGSRIDLDFMRQTDRFGYYEDPSGRRYAMFGLEGDIWLTVCLDQGVLAQDFFHAMYQAEPARLDVKMPKLDMETELDNQELVDFLSHLGAGVAFSDFADFSKMTDSPDGWHIGDIVQKTRIRTDEKGMEAAAVTAIMMVDNAMVIEPETPVEFYMDRPFSFLITAGRYSVDSDAVVLFFGQYAG